MHKLSMMVIAALTLVSCNSSTAGNDTNSALNEPVDAPLAPPPDATQPADAATLGQAIAASIDGGISDNAKIISATADLNGDGVEEALAYLVDPMFCGTGGCSLYVLGQKDGKWAVLDEIGPSQLPVYKLASTPGGWADLGVSIAGGGSKPALMKLPHGADGYADNPTVSPATETIADGATLLIADDFDKAVPIKKDAKAQ